MKLVCTLFLLLIHVPIFALQVDVKELKTKPIRFINYKGPYGKKESISEVTSIGTQLAASLEKSKNIARYHNKYRIIRAHSIKMPEKFSADIFSVDKNARVTHIRYLRRILAGYLSKRYGYNQRLAYSIALYITYYNAIHRGEINYFREKYKPIVLKYIDKRNAGISTRYDQWPGRSRLLIPLTSGSGSSISGIDPDILSDKETSKAVRGKGGNITARKDVTNLREKVHDKERSDIAKKKKKLKEERSKVEKERIAIEKRERALKKEQERLNREKSSLTKEKDPSVRKKRGASIAKREKDLAKKKGIAEKKKKEIKRTEEKIKREESSTAKKERSLEKREDDTREEKKLVTEDEINKEIDRNPRKAAKLLKKKSSELASKEEELDKREDTLRDTAPEKNVYAGKFYYLKVKEYLEGGHYRNDMYMIDAATQRILFKSPVDNIAGRRYDIFSAGVVVVTFDRVEMGVHHLTLLNRSTLASKFTGSANVFWRSFIEIKDGFIYAIVLEKNKYYLGKFDGSLKLVARSSQAIDSNSFITFFKDLIYINADDNNILILDKNELTKKDIVVP